MTEKILRAISHIAELYFRYRPRNHTRISLKALVVAGIIATPTALDYILLFFSVIDEQILPDYNGIVYAYYLIIIILSYHFISSILEFSLRQFNPLLKKQAEENKKAFDVFQKHFSYQFMKRNLEDAEFGVNSDFVLQLSIAGVFLDPKYSLFDKELESKRIDLINEILSYNHFLSLHLYHVHGNPDRLAIPGEWKHQGMMDKYKDHEKKIRKRSMELLGKVYEFYQLSREKKLLETDN